MFPNITIMKWHKNAIKLIALDFKKIKVSLEKNAFKNLEIIIIFLLLCIGFSTEKKIVHFVVDLAYKITFKLFIFRTMYRK